MPDRHQQLPTVTLELHPNPFGDLSRSPYDLTYGEEERDDTISAKGLEVRLGTRPLARNIQHLYELGHDGLPQERALYDTYDLWIITHTVGVIRRRGRAEVRLLGYEARFDDEDTLYTVELLPQSQFVTRAGASVGVHVDLGAEGHAQVPDAVRNLLDSVEFLGADARISLSSDFQILGRISLSAISPIVQAVGKGSSRCEWCITADEEPLFGDQTLLQVVLVPKAMDRLTFRARAYAAIKPRWLAPLDRRDTDWVEIECPLA